MADLCGGHPADVLIAVCLAAKALTMPGRQGARAGERCHADCWAAGTGVVLPGKLPGWRLSAGEGGRGMPVCALSTRACPW